ncbi:hypothetical protein [Anaeroselena agilis]|uniref:DUF2933 domain-containing protein n=1 Tax=Anaeroselena agilis TaxID=3063788 RepID=A0ABU3NTI6_9FIRM|nr:hypothetical protein [Selenomonadales bacterium 4137-cl]
MDWSILLSLICPIMMLLCMKGMFSGHNHGDAKGRTEQPQISPEEVQAMQTKMAELSEQNAHLLKELQSMKETFSNDAGMKSNNSLSN